MLKYLDSVDDGGSWEELKKESEVGTNNESQRLNKLTVLALEGFTNGFVMNTKKMMIMEKKAIKHDFGTGTGSKSPSVEEEKEDYLIKKQKKQKTSDAKKQKTGIEKKQNQRKGFNPVVELSALGLEPPPDMPQVFKNRIENLGGTDIKLE
ncbi:hypothetical protein QQP08_005001 [Theobroma cacao]|nr:hypothetical protein QQP08_005001 [Theobroma cacao]